MSFENVKNRWFPELKEYCPESPILLVGTKSDLKTDEATIQTLAKQGLTPVTQDMAHSLAKELHLAGYLECSGMTQAGVKIVFDEAARLAVGKPLMVANKMSKSPSMSRIRKPQSSNLSSVSSPGTTKKKGCSIL
jgi:Ras-related C3 botulinum toxin substrate 1